MSSSELKKLANSVLKDLKTTANKAEKDARKQLENQEGQILIINKTRFSNNLIQLMTELAGKEGKKAREEIWTLYSTKLEGLESKVSKVRLKEMKEVYGTKGRKIPGIRSNDYVFFIKTYGSAKRAKGVLLKAVVKRVLTSHKKTFSEENLSKLGGKDNKTGAQLGHAEDGLGYAASTVRVARAQRLLSNSSISQKESIKDLITTFENTIGMTIDHSQVISAKGLKKGYIPILSWQKAISNNSLATLEAQAIKSFQEGLKDIATLKSSTSLVDGISMVMLDAAAPKKARNTKVKGKRKKVIKESSKTQSSTKLKQRKKARLVRDNVVPKSVLLKKEQSKGISSSPLALIGILNKELPQTVKKNMRLPGLENQTGRFASSVKVTDISSTAQGFPSIGYTYQKDPYQVFEMGAGRAPWATPERDPRKLIDRSIREIAAELAIGRFYTRRN